MKKQKPKLIIFDYDGVIVNTVEWGVKAFTTSFKRLGYPIKKEDIIIGEPREAQFRSIIDKYQITLSFEKFLSELEKIPKRDSEFIRANKGFPQLAKKLSQYYPLAIVSNNLVENIERKLKEYKMESYFKKIVGIEDEERFQGVSKEKRLKSILREFHLSGSETVLVDDIPKHIEIAHRLGIRTIAYLYKYNQHMKFPSYSYIAKSAKEIEEYFLS